MKSLIAERARTPDSGENVLFFGTRTRDDFYYQEEFAALEAAGLLKARVAFSRDDIEAHFDSQQGAYRLEDAERHRVDAVILREENARYIWDMLRSPEEGGSGAYFYLCGRTAFATSILNAIKSIIARFNEGASPEENGRILYELVGQGRFCLEIFTTYAGRHFDDEKQKIPVSAVVRRNNDQDGYWVIINGRVYDMTEFGHIHAGGMKIVQSYSGMDGTYAYQKVGHDVNPEVDAMLGMYELGVLAMPNFDSRWGVAVGLEGLQYISLRDAYQAWAKLAFMVVEMENAVMNDFRTLDEPMTEMENDGVPRITPFKVNQIALAHDRLVNNYLAQVVGEPLSVLWSLTSGLLGETRSGSDWMKDAMESVQQSEAAKAAQALHVRMSEAILADERRLSDFEDAEHRYGPMCRWLAERDQHAIRQLKLTLCEGLEVIETLQAETVSSGGPRLMTILKRFPQVLGEFYDRLAEGEERLSV